MFSMLARVRVWYLTAGAEVVNLYRPMQGMRVTGYEGVWSIAATGEWNHPLVLGSMTALVVSGSGTLLLSPCLRPRAMSLR